MPLGSMEKALSGQYEVDFRTVLEEGWEITKTRKSAILQGMVFVFALLVVVTLASIQLFGLSEEDWQKDENRFVIDFLVNVLVAPFAAALMMMGIKHSVNETPPSGFLFNFVPQIFILSIATIMIGLVVQLGLIVLIVPGLYLMIATGFTIPLMLEKSLTPGRAMLISIKAVNHKWFEFIKIYSFFALLGMLVIITFGVALIWVIPFYYNVKGVLFRNIFGLEHLSVKSEINEVSNSSDDVFHA